MRAWIWHVHSMPHKLYFNWRRYLYSGLLTEFAAGAWSVKMYFCPSSSLVPDCKELGVGIFMGVSALFFQDRTYHSVLPSQSSITVWLCSHSEVDTRDVATWSLWFTGHKLWPWWMECACLRTGTESMQASLGCSFALLVLQWLHFRWVWKGPEPV